VESHRPMELALEKINHLKKFEHILKLNKKGDLILPELLQYLLDHFNSKNRGEGIRLKLKATISPKRLLVLFEELGFVNSPLVYEPGQIRLQGEIIEFWDHISTQPIKIEFFDNEIEQIYFYDLRTRKKIENLKTVFIYPLEFKKGAKTKLVDLGIQIHSRENFLKVSRLAQKKNQIIFIFSHLESAFLEITSDHKAQIFILPSLSFPGFSLGNIHFFTDLDFAKKIKIKRFANIKEFKVGDFVVHIDHGICKLEGIGPKSLPLSLDEQILGAKERRDFYYHLRFRHNAFLYANLSEHNRITKYIGSNPRLSVLGGKEWHKLRLLASIEAKILSQKLSKLFAQIKKQKIEFDFKKANEAERILDKSFGFSLTRSQENNLLRIKKLLRSRKPLDHLIAGEAASGKTEVALRLSSWFLANFRQVLLLSPTTFLAYQNFLVAKNRLSHLGIRVGVLSRFNSKEENKKTIDAYNRGKIEFLVGTHKILFAKINLSDTGLLLIDEEQRFGVEQKEKIRLKKPDISIVSLSATPIPRTLNLALNGAKSMSLIKETPFSNQKIEDFILGTKQLKKLKKIIKKETESNRQVYFVAPRIADLHEIKANLEGVGIKNAILAHGRMGEKRLAQVFSDFSLGKIKLLLSTQIVEHGLDFPKARTMILWYSGRLGLADLYQLRGRISRSEFKAQFIAVVPADLADSAYTRLIDFLTLMKNKDAFLKLALKDLENRGEGEIFGKRQHGVINKVGLYLFSEMVKIDLRSKN